MVTNDYGTSPEEAISQFSETDWLEGNYDRGTMHKLFDRNGFQDKNIENLSNKRATRENIMNAGSRLANTSVTYIQGHSRYRSTNAGTEYLTQDFFTHDPPQGLTCGDLFDMFLPCGSGPTRRLVLTDTCYSYNFNELQYRLEVNSGSSPDWVEYPDWDETISRDENDILVHLAAGSPDQQANELNGGFFTNGFCRAMRIPRTLPDLLETVRSDVENSMRKHRVRGRLQVPQIYSSYDFDLDDVNVMKTFGFFRDSASYA